eukprot:UN31978
MTHAKKITTMARKTIKPKQKRNPAIFVPKDVKQPFKGVGWHETKKKYCSSFHLQNKTNIVGFFDDPCVAAKMQDIELLRALPKDIDYGLVKQFFNFPHLLSETIPVYKRKVYRILDVEFDTNLHILWWYVHWKNEDVGQATWEPMISVERFKVFKDHIQRRLDIIKSQDWCITVNGERMELSGSQLKFDYDIDNDKWN